MSGIAGILRFDGAPIEPGLVDSMTSAMAHRGPDGIRHWTQGAVALGQCMLCTTAESLEEKQPLANEDQSLVLVMDGRLDNWEELRRELSGRGAMLRDRSDAELALRAYESWGRECLARLDGDFALAIWDARREVAFCARDRLGNRPFHYHWDGARLTFSSELHAILAMPWVRVELNEGLLAEYLSIEWHARDETPWNGIRRLVPAHWMEVGRSGRQAKPYWRPELHAPLVYRRDEDYVEHYRDLFADTVRRHSRSHRALACEVSGGLDSSAIFAVAADLERRRALLAPRIAAFTLKFDDDTPANELRYARAVAAHVGLPVQEIAPTFQPLSWYRDWTRKYREFPGYPNGVMALGIREAAVREGCRALLHGCGGDERLTGTRDYYVEEVSAGRWLTLLRCLLADLRGVGAKQALWWLARACAIACLPDRAQDRLRKLLRRSPPPAESGEWLVPELKELARRRKAGRVDPASGVEFGRSGQVAQYEILHGAFDVMAREMEERACASLGLELRGPFTSAAMVQFAFSTPERLRMRGATGKMLHRRAMTGLLPPLVLERTTKADFMAAFWHHAGELRALFGAELAKNGDDWVRRRDLEKACALLGDAEGDSVPEWQLWSLFGWRALRTAADR
jgi:asparagine synthase (glutamine-hydrolysing)